MKITIRIERDKSHFIKKCFATIGEAKKYLEIAEVCETKHLLRKWVSEGCK